MIFLKSFFYPCLTFPVINILTGSCHDLAIVLTEGKILVKDIVKLGAQTDDVEAAEARG